MTPHIPFEQAVDKICRHDPSFSHEAYYFMRDALDHTNKMLRKGTPKNRVPRHVSGQELLEGIRTYALDQFGPMALTVLHEWGVKTGEDFGVIVFNLAAAGVFGLTPEDSLDDFRGGYDFQDAFVKPFLPTSPTQEPFDSQARRGLKSAPKRSASKGSSSTPHQHEA